MDPNMPGMDHDMPGMDHGDMDMGGATGSKPFCTGGGRVMYSGFTFMQNAPEMSGHGSGTCMLWLFQGAVVDTRGKYAAAIIGTFLLAAAMEGARYGRMWLRKQRAGLAKDRNVAVPILLEALAFAVHMLLAYLVMLLVMLYEAAIFMAILIGLATGYFAFELLLARLEAKGTELPAVGGCGCSDEAAMPIIATATEVNPPATVAANGKV